MSIYETFYYNKNVFKLRYFKFCQYTGTPYKEYLQPTTLMQYWVISEFFLDLEVFHSFQKKVNKFSSVFGVGSDINDCVLDGLDTVLLTVLEDYVRAHPTIKYKSYKKEKDKTFKVIINK